MVEHLFDDHDAHFTPTFGKWLETRSRLTMVEQVLADGATRDTDSAIELLASGRDGELVQSAQQRGLDLKSVGIERSFGRVLAKRMDSSAASSAATRQGDQGTTRFG